MLIVIFVYLLCFVIEIDCFKFVKPMNYLKLHQGQRKISSINLIDATTEPLINSLTQVDPITLNQQFGVAYDSFSQTFSSRMVGTVFGNILAGVCIKVASDFIWNKFDKPRE